MVTSKLLFFLFCVVLAISSQAQDPWKLFELSDLQKQRTASQKIYLPFLNEESFSMGLYELKARAIDNQPVHDDDEIYYLAAGRAKLVAGDSTFDVSPGSIVYVRAGVDHRFVEITEDLSVLVIFSQTPSRPGDPDALQWHTDLLRNEINLDENVWSQFLFVSTMRMGLYSLPLKRGGDQPLNHKVDEINIITKGEATFVVGEEAIPVKQGSIVWVKEGNPHSFKDLNGDFDVLITFHIKP